MGSYIPDQIIDDVRDRADIVEIIGGFVALKQAGTIFKGLCPFHVEKTPSFTVNPERRIFHCFGCGVGGNVFNFLMKQKGISFPEAVTELAERYGIDLPSVNPAHVRVARSAKTALYQAVGLAHGFYRDELAAGSGREAREYLTNRGISSEMIEQFGLGWAPRGWDHLYRFLASKRVPVEVMERGGLIKPRTSGRGHYDTFRARVICPILDLDGKTAAFGGRLIAEEENQPKYLNSPETPIYRKGRLLYGLERCRSLLRQTRTVYIVEGYFDLLSMVAHGVQNVAATLGTALTPDHLRLLKGYVEQTILVFDADQAGRNAAARALPLFLSADMEGRVLQLPDGHDPDSYMRAHGPEAFVKAAEEAVSLLDFYLSATLARYPDNMSGKSLAAQEVLGVISRIDHPTRRDLLRGALAERLNISEEALRLSERRAAVEEVDNRAGVVNGVTASVENELIKLLIHHTEIVDKILTAGLGPHLDDSNARRIYEAINRQVEKYGRLDMDRLVETLDTEDADWVTGLALGDDGYEGQDLSEVADDFINRYSQRIHRNKIVDLTKRIRQAQQTGNEEELVFLLQEKNQLLREK